MTSPNLIRKVQGWQDCTYTDGSSKKHEEGHNNTGSGAPSPKHIPLSHYMNPRLANAISRAELAAAAAAIIHDYSATNPNAKTEANCHAYYQTLIKNGIANGATSNAYLTSSYVPFKTKSIIMRHRTGTLYNQ